MFYYLLYIVTVFVVYFVFLNICKYSLSITKTIAAFFIMYIALISTITIFKNTFPNLGVDIPINVVITASLVLLAYVKTKNKLLSAFHAILTTTIVMMIDHIMDFLVSLIFDIDVIEGSLYLHIIMPILIFVACYVVSKYLGNWLHQCYTQLSSLEVKQKFAAYGLVFSTLTFLISHVNVHIFRDIAYRVYFPTINIILIAGAFFVAIFMLGAYALSQQREMEGEYRSKAQADLEGYTRNLERAYDDMRSFRHDHLNLLYSLMGYTKEDGAEKIREFLTQNVALAQDALDNLDAATNSLQYIHIPELKGLLSIKFAQAQTKGIQVQLDIETAIEDIPISRMEICRIAGIIVDNAIDELKSDQFISENPINRIIKFGIIDDGSEILIICSNTYKTAPRLETMFDKGYSTRGIARGLGLYNLKRICEENKSLLLAVRVDNGEFTIIVTIRRE